MVEKPHTKEPINHELEHPCKRTILLLAIGFSPLASAEAAWIDVRTAIEHGLDSIDGDVRIGYGDIVEGVEALFPEKDTEIRLYCRSGGRAGKAMAALHQAGYTNVSNAGGIDDARRQRGLSE